jgi:hypothetical protein
MPPGTAGFELGEKLEVPGVIAQVARLHDDIGRKALQHGGHATQMIRMDVGDHDDGQSPHTLSPEKGNHDAPPRIRPVEARSRVDQDPVSTGRADRGAITLADLKKM